MTFLLARCPVCGGNLSVDESHTATCLMCAREWRVVGQRLVEPGREAGERP